MKPRAEIVSVIPSGRLQDIILALEQEMTAYRDRIRKLDVALAAVRGAARTVGDLPPKAPSRRRDWQKASRITQALKAGKPVSVADRAWKANYDKTKQKRTTKK